MNGYVQIYTRDAFKSKDQLFMRLTNVYEKAYDHQLKPLHINELQQRAYLKNKDGELIYSGNLGTLRVAHAMEEPDLVDLEKIRSFFGTFQGSLIEFNLSSNVRAVPDYAFKCTPRERRTMILFNQFDENQQLHREVLLRTTAGSLSFHLEVHDEPQHIEVTEWAEKFKEYGIEVDIRETLRPLDQEKFVDGLYAEVPLSDTSGIPQTFYRDYKTVAQRAAASDKLIYEPLPEPVESSTLVRAKVFTPPPELIEDETDENSEPIKKMGTLLMLEVPHDSEDEAIACDSESESSDSERGEYHPLYLEKLDAFKEDMALPVREEPLLIVDTPELLKAPEDRLKEIIDSMNLPNSVYVITK